MYNTINTDSELSRKFARKAAFEQLLCDSFFATSLTLLTIVAVYVLVCMHLEFRAVGNPENWTVTTAQVKSTRVQYRHRGASERYIYVTMQVDGGAPFEDTVGPKYVKDANAILAEISATKQVKVFKNKDPQYGYVLSYTYTACSKYLTRFIVASLVTVVGLGAYALFWRFVRRQLQTAAALRPRLAGIQGRR